MTHDQIDLVIADDHDLFRDGLAALLERDSRIRVVGQASSDEEAVQLTNLHHPSLLLLDVEMPGGHVRTTLSRLRRQAPDTIVVILTMHADAVLRHDLLEAGATGYLTKSLSGAEVVQALHEYSSGRIDHFQKGETSTSGIAISPLTDRERTVLTLMSRAMPNPAIAQELSIAVGTVRRHVYSIYCKLGATSRVDAIRHAEAVGLVANDPYPQLVQHDEPHG